MFYPWLSTMMLTAEASHVIALRFAKISLGGQGALDESKLMVDEKIAASWEAAATLMHGGSSLTVIDRYREHVAHNASRLTTR